MRVKTKLKKLKCRIDSLVRSIKSESNDALFVESSVRMVGSLIIDQYLAVSLCYRVRLQTESRKFVNWAFLARRDDS